MLAEALMLWIAFVASFGVVGCQRLVGVATCYAALERDIGFCIHLCADNSAFAYPSPDRPVALPFSDQMSKCAAIIRGAVFPLDAAAYALDPSPG